MDHSDADQPNPQVTPVAKENTGINRPITLPALVTSGLAPVISVCVIALMLGAAGGLLLGGTQVTVLQSLELLADNKLLMDQLGKHIMDSGLNETNNHLHDSQISLFAVMFGVFTSFFSLVVGIYIGFSTYSLVIKIKGEAAMGKALALAGPACLTGVTATGYILGHSLESFLSITRNVVLPGFRVSVAVAVCMYVITPCINSLLFKFVLIIALITCAIFTTYILISLLKLRSILAVGLTPTILAPMILAVKEFSLIFATVPLLVMLIISDIYKTVGQPIVAIQSSASTNTTSAVVEAIFVGVLACQMWTVAVGMSLFVYWQRGGAGKICLAAAASGGAVLTVIKAALPVLGPGPSIGALMGVTGAVGVSLSAAVAAIDQYRQVVDHCGYAGSLGVTVGAAVGAFLSSCAHSGLSGMFMGLCAATIPAVALLRMFLHSKS